MLKISVIICTYNRWTILKNAISSLSQQTAEKSMFEVIVVDNGTGAKTKNTVLELEKKFPKLNIRYIRESHEGLSNARNTGVANSKSAYVAFLDDDAKADNQWISCILGYINRKSFSSIALGGIILPFYEENKPDWFRDSYESDLKGDSERFLKKGETFSGSNMILKKEYVKKFGGFNKNIGMKGEYMSVGEETSLFELIWNANSNKSKIYFYSPSLIVYHYVAPYRMKVSYRLKRNLISGQALYIRYCAESTYKKTLLVGRMLLRTFFAFILIPIPVWPFYRKRWVVERIGPLLFGGGFLLSFFKINLSFIRD